MYTTHTYHVNTNFYFWCNESHLIDLTVLKMFQHIDIKSDHGLNCSHIGFRIFFFYLFQSIIENINTTAKLQFQLYFPSHEPFLPKIWIINQWIVFYIISRKYIKTANVILHVSLSMFMFCTCNIVKVLCSFKDILPFTHPYIIPYLFYEWWPQMFLSPFTFIVCERAAWTFC